MFPWAVLFQLAAAKLSWPPDVFWRSTPKELDLALGLGSRETRMTRNHLNSMMVLHPDKTGAAGQVTE
jgi:uncharacterized phage protein (TIGR02216 family)